MNYSEGVSDNDLKFEFLGQIQDGGQYQRSDFLPLLFEYLGYEWGRNYGRVRVAANLIQMHAIGWINGEKLLDLLIEHEIGLRKRPVQLYELDEDFLRADDEAAIVE